MTILVKPPELRKYAKQIHDHARQLQRAIDDVDNEFKQLGESRFSGKSANHIRRRYNKAKSQINSFKPLLDNFARELEETARRFEQADSQLGS